MDSRWGLASRVRDTGARSRHDEPPLEREEENPLQSSIVKPIFDSRPRYLLEVAQVRRQEHRIDRQGSGRNFQVLCTDAD